MIENLEKNQKKSISFATITALLIGYITICGALWHIGYWPTFDFNYLAYVSFSDLFKSVIQPFFSDLSLGIYGIFLLATVGMGFILMIFTKNFDSKPLVINHHSDNNHFLFSKKIDFFLIGACFFWPIMIVFSLRREFLTPSTWILGVGITFALYNSGVLKNIIKTQIVRLFTLAIIVIFALFNFTSAKNQALKVSYRWIFNSVSDIKLRDSSMNKNFIGRPFLISSEKFTFFLNKKKM